MNIHQSIHGVSKVEIDDITDLNNETQTRHLIITDKDGNRMSFTLFAEDAEALKVQLTGSLPIKV